MSVSRNHILVVEDELELQETIKEILVLSGYKVSTASNGKEGLKSIIDQEPDLVLCDVNMPELDGFELLSTVNERLKGTIPPSFLFLSAKVEKEDIRHGMNLGADDYLLKPFRKDELLRIIRLRLDKKKQILDSSSPVEKSNDNHVHRIALPCEDGLELVPYDRIIKCQAERAYCQFHLIDGKKILVSKPMREFETKLLANNFFRVHKSTIVNLDFVEKYVRGKGGQLLLSDGSIIAVSASRKEDLLDIVNAKT